MRPGHSPQGNLLNAGFARGYKRYVLGILLFAYAFNYLDRQVMAVAMESIKHDLAISDTQIGILTGAAFALFYSVVGIPIARWADRSSRPRIIALCLCFLSITVALCGFAVSFVQLLVLRTLVGIGEAGIVPPTHSLVASYFERAERARAMSIVLQGGPLSIVVGSVLGGWLTQLFGWRIALMAVAVPGITLAAVIWGTVVDPVRSSPAQPGDAAPVIAAPSVRAIVTALWRKRTFRYLLYAFGIDYLCGYGLQQWLPVFFIRAHGMSTGELGGWLALNWGVGNAIGTFAGGYLTRRATVNPERKQLQIMAFVTALYVGVNSAMLFSTDKHVALALMFVATLINALAMAPWFALLQSLAPENGRATAVAAVFLVGNLIGLGLGPLLVGMLSDGLHHAYGNDSLRIALLICAPGYFWVAAQYYRASRTVTADLSDLRSEDPGQVSSALA
jgi:predicted MFS family arabinose efflux permease